MWLNDIIAGISGADLPAQKACQIRLDSVAKPLGSLGKFEELLFRIAGAAGSADIAIDKKCVLVFCADNGVVAQGVAQSGQEITAAIARSLLAGTASINVMARRCNADVFVIDVGMAHTVRGVIDRKTARGTSDFSRGPAMTREQALFAVKAGFDLVGEKKAEGYRLLAMGEAGIGNTSTSGAVASALLSLPPEQVTGRGSGLSDEGLARKIAAIRRGIAVNRPDPKDPVDVIAKLGGFDIAAMTGAFLGGAYHRIPVVMDGLISSVAALCAVRLCPAVREYIIPSHTSAEPAGPLIMRELGFSPVIDAGLRLGEGTGAAALFPLLDMAAAVYRDAATFDDLKMEAYKR